MAKRFTDSNKFKDIWYRKLSPVHKCLWEYLLSECNHAGLITFDLEAMSFLIGTEIKRKDLEIFAERIVFINADLLFIPKFLSFQYGFLNPENKVHKSVLALLGKYNIDPNKPLPSPLLGAMDKVMELDKIKTKVKEVKKSFGEFENVKLLETEETKLRELYGDKFNEAIEVLSSYIASKGDKYKNHYAVLGKSNWVYKRIMIEGVTATRDVTGLNLD